MNEYNSDIELGKLYEDTSSGIQGIAESVHFYRHACERVSLEYVAGNQELKQVTFDAPRLKCVETGEVAKSSKPGGPARAGEIRDR